MTRHLMFGLSTACVLLALGFFIKQKPISPLNPSASANKTMTLAPATSPTQTTSLSTAKDSLNETRNEHQQQLKILEEKQQAIATAMDKLALLKKEQETTAKTRLDKQEQQIVAREKRQNSSTNTRPRVAASANTRVAELTNTNAIKPQADVLPESETKQEQKTATEKSKTNEDLFVTPGF